jgi:outer membrane protein assembly factor BamE (lipoprotein component of BamABCDE complex)
MRTPILAVALAGAVAGCSVYEAIHAPPPVEYRHVQVGETRSETISHLGAPRFTDSRDGMKVDHFEFTDGYNPASKARIILYIAGDLFTACLAEVIFWPIELAVMDGQQCRAKVEYDPNDFVASYLVESRGGKQLWASSAPAASPVIESKPPTHDRR